MNPNVDQYFESNDHWQKEIRKLREIVLSCGLTEEFKWECPCYTFDGANIVLIHVFKEYCALLFFKGALLNDPNTILVQQTQNVQAARQIRFTSVSEIEKMAAVVKSYIEQAIEVEKKGLQVEMKKTSEFPVPEEFQRKLDEIPPLKDAFEALTPGRQRAYLLFLTSAKLSKTREERVEKYVDRILDGLGLHD